MITPAYARTMAAYNAEMNRRIYAPAGVLTDEQRGADRGLFWRSIHGTLAHILWADLRWMASLAGWPPPPGIPQDSAGFIADFAELRERRVEADAGMVAWAGGIGEDWLAGEHVWFNRITQTEMRRSNAFLVVHVFTHQVHHRGQVHAALTGFGVQTADTDLWAAVEQEA
ncbi:DinB family protein [Paracraurococcus lichenis]|uniref:DinB family protein n=1 Tax=Paracraurococcus lichenis TaxID=3064888 RepID=A0ABT9EBW3_9PROT|nr:DinB family protein [Paracraurococcus sp. LOR1-02]MDO9713692.1 DinB family protein [Paracraurococcus sp. LOR1-02]